MAVLEAWLRKDIAFYPKRIKMDSASVKTETKQAAHEFHQELKKAARDVPLSVVKAAVKKVRKNV